MTMRVETQASPWQAGHAKAATADGKTPSAFAATLAQASQEATEPQRYDFRNIRPTQLRATVNALIRSGQMDLDETSSLLGFMPSPLATVDGTVSVQDDAPIDVYARIQAGIEGALSRLEWRNAGGLRPGAAALQGFQV